ncbi:MAG TPA: site-2 protease family protein [Nitrososphaeraceae archaeon]
MTVAKIRGIRIKIHYTFIIIFVLVTWSLSAYLIPTLIPGLSFAVNLYIAVTGAAVLFSSVILHELAHSIMAIRYGIKVRQIVLFIFGGVSDIEEEPKEFQKEFNIAIVGPLTSFGLAGIFSLFSFIIENIIGIGTSTALQAIDVVLYYGALANIMLGAFNLIPAFPLDGGRILRATLVKRKRDYDAATRSVIRVSIIISYALMGFGFLGIITRSFVGGLWILLIGWFLNVGAHSYMQQRELGSILSSVTLRHIMNTNMIAVKNGTNLYDVLTKYFGFYMKTAFPVTDDSGSVIGLITLTVARAIPEHKWMYTIVDDIMIPRNDLIIMDANSNADEALNKMAIRKMNIIFISNGEGGIAGLVTKTDILNIAAERKKYFDALRQE